MHHVADFYEVLGLRDACCRFLVDSLRPHNCCHLLERAYGVHCELLVQRCHYMLTLDFIAVVEHDRDFPSLSATTLAEILARDELVCAEEYEVFEAIAKYWYLRAPTDEKFVALRELLPLVRWPLVRPEKADDVFALTARLRPPRLPATDGADNAPPSLATAGAQWARAGWGRQPALSDGSAVDVGDRDGAVYPESHAESEAYAESHDETNADADADTMSEALEGPVLPRRLSSVGRGKEAVSPFQPFDEEETEATLLVRELYPPAPPSEGTDEDANVDQSPSALPKLPLPRERQYYWGELISRNPPPPAGTPAPVPNADDEKTYQLQSTKEYMVGRSRKSDIRIGHQAPMPYISSQHFRIYHSIRWPSLDPAGDGMGVLGSSDDDEAARTPTLEAWLEDLSQNGTFVNSTLVGKNKSQILHANDRIEMVFPHGRQPAQQMHNAFPIFTYVPRSTQRPPSPTTSAVGDATADDTQQMQADETEGMDTIGYATTSA